MCVCALLSFFINLINYYDYLILSCKRKFGHLHYELSDFLTKLCAALALMYTQTCNGSLNQSL